MRKRVCISTHTEEIILYLILVKKKHNLVYNFLMF